MKTYQNSSPKSILMFPWLAHGHVFPYLELAKKLSSRNFKIYFCSTGINLGFIKNHLAETKSLSGDIPIELVEQHLPSLPELPPEYHTTKHVPPHLHSTLLKALQMSRSNFCNIISKIMPDLVIFDGFQPWAAKQALSQGIPAVYFATSGAIPYCFGHHHYVHGKTPYPFPEIYLHDYERKAMPSKGEIYIEDGESGFLSGIFKLSCDIVLIKSCMGIEEKYINYLSELSMKKLIPVGPLVSVNEEEGSDIMNWLNMKTLFSTVFISFGSECYLSSEDIQEIAKGLELINVNFIWVIRFPVGSNTRIEDVLNDGFLERVKDRGLIVPGWAPQASILAHSNTGGFVSHCGWSSVIESIYFGVPVIALPTKLDQPFNARMVVELGVGLEVERNDTGELKGENVSKAIKKILIEEDGKMLRAKAREVGEKMKMEQEQGIDEAAEQLLQLCVQKKKKSQT